MAPRAWLRVLADVDDLGCVDAWLVAGRGGLSERCFGLGVCADESGLDDGGLRGRRVLRAAKLSIIAALP